VSLSDSFISSPREMFYSIAWTTLLVESGDPPQMNILAAAGARGTLHLIHPEDGVAFFEYQIIRSKTVTVSSLLFHPKQCSILFCKFHFLPQRQVSALPAPAKKS
jgi:hypothetical protein